MIAGVLGGGLALEVTPHRRRRRCCRYCRNVEFGCQPHRLAGLGDLLGDEVTGMGLWSSSASLNSTAERSAGVAPDQPGSARAAATAGRRPGRGQRQFGDDLAGGRVNSPDAGHPGGDWRPIDPATRDHRSMLRISLLTLPTTTDSVHNHHMCVIRARPAWSTGRDVQGHHRETSAGRPAPYAGIGKAVGLFGGRSAPACSGSSTPV